MKFTSQDIKLFDEIFTKINGAGYILDFSDKKMREFFEEELAIDIDNDIYKDDGLSKAKRLRCFIKKSDRETVLAVLDKLWTYRKTIKTHPMTPDDEMSYSRLIERLKSVDDISSVGIVPPKLETTNTPNYQYFIRELEAMKAMNPQQRGYRFESWLNELFAAFHLIPNPGFRIAGEQIDGSFILHNETYLVEAKWHNQKTAAPDLHVFQSKLEQKATWTRGVFISWQGFSSEAFEAWGKNKSIICITGCDLYYMLTNNISLIELLEKKIRHAAERGEYFIAIDKLYPGLKFSQVVK
ncbi:restriction endonuclease [Citrobacter sp. S2-9]|uniref:Restriction endonuclease n=1 Tax=Citrobacter enshiensis TaxID=2971264 RepID=A0ABT8Q2L3_9ENTR|nr:restriction endonuclease [Citrobacter enshiensis]MDN8601819.1 restriction endonuclease [Citrobacter enshiensis]